MSSIPIELPELGSEGEPIVVVAWLVEPGEHVVGGDRLVEVVVRGVVFEVRSPGSGTLSRIAVKVDDVVPERGVLGWYEPVVGAVSTREDAS